MTPSLLPIGGRCRLWHRRSDWWGPQRVAQGRALHSSFFGRIDGNTFDIRRVCLYAGTWALGTNCAVEGVPWRADSGNSNAPGTMPGALC